MAGRWRAFACGFGAAYDLTGTAALGRRSLPLPAVEAVRAEAATEEECEFEAAYRSVAVDLDRWEGLLLSAEAAAPRRGARVVSVLLPAALLGLVVWLLVAYPLAGAIAATAVGLLAVGWLAFYAVPAALGLWARHRDPSRASLLGASSWMWLCDRRRGTSATRNRTTTREDDHDTPEGEQE